MVNVTLNRLSVLYIEHCRGYYRKNGTVISEVSSIRCALKVLLSKIGQLPVNNFTPLNLKAIRDAMIKKGWVRQAVQLTPGFALRSLGVKADSLRSLLFRADSNGADGKMWRQRGTVAVPTPFWHRRLSPQPHAAENVAAASN